MKIYNIEAKKIWSNKIEQFHIKAVDDIELSFILKDKWYLLDRIISYKSVFSIFDVFSKISYIFMKKDVELVSFLKWISTSNSNKFKDRIINAKCEFWSDKKYIIKKLDKIVEEIEQTWNVDPVYLFKKHIPFIDNWTLTIFSYCQKSWSADPYEILYNKSTIKKWYSQILEYKLNALKDLKKDIPKIGIYLVILFSSLIWWPILWNKFILMLQENAESLGKTITKDDLNILSYLMISLGSFIVNNWIEILIFLILLVFLYNYLYHVYFPFKRFIQYIPYNIYKWKDVKRCISSIQFVWMLNIFVEIHRSDISKAFKTCWDIIDDYPIKTEAYYYSKMINKWISLSEAISRYPDNLKVFDNKFYNELKNLTSWTNERSWRYSEFLPELGEWLISKWESQIKSYPGYISSLIMSIALAISALSIVWIALIIPIMYS